MASTATRGLKGIAPVPTANDFLDIVLSKTQRQTPTEIHKNFKIARIRSFYMRKVKYCAEMFDEKLTAILTEFPILDNLHPFISSLMNVLYDKNHYKLALGQLNTAKHLIEQVSKDYLRLLKFGDSLYRCKQLKKAALGRMATIMRRQKDPLAYLEQVRQHISRLPAVDPNTRTLLICGYPNVGKSSFINKVTRAEVDVQPYAFTTKSLFVGHLDYKYLRWQVIDTPGILDHPLEDMNTIEMQSITALAHLRACILYFMDLSEQCGYSVEAQCKLFHSIKPLFANKPVMLVINKIDVKPLSELPADQRALIDEILSKDGATLIQTSCYSEEGVIEARNTACEALLAARVDAKLKGHKVKSIINRIHVAMPKSRDEVVREPFIPEVVRQRQAEGKKWYDPEDPERPKLSRDVEAEEGGPGVYNVNLKQNYILEKEEWKNDIVPEIWQGKNVLDFIDPDIAEKLEALEREEEKLEAEGFYDSDDSFVDSEYEGDMAQKEINESKRVVSVLRRVKSNHSIMPRTNAKRTVSDLATSLKKSGYNSTKIEERAILLAKAAGLKRKRGDGEEMEVDEDEWEDMSDDDDAMDVEGGSKQVTPLKKRKTNAGAKATLVTPVDRKNHKDRNLAGLKGPEAVAKVRKLYSMQAKKFRRQGRKGEADTHIPDLKPKHLHSGKRGFKANRR